MTCVAIKSSVGMTSQRLVLSFILLGSAILSVGCGTAAISSVPAKLGNNRLETFELVEIDINLGVLHQRESREHRCWLRNPSDKPLQIARFTSSCDCVAVSVEDQVVAPTEKTLMTIRFDGEHEADFIGSLAIPVSLVDRDGRKVDVGVVRVEVTADPRIAQLLRRVDNPPSRINNGASPDQSSELQPPGEA